MRQSSAGRVGLSRRRASWYKPGMSLFRRVPGLRAFAAAVLLFGSLPGFCRGAADKAPASRTEVGLLGTACTITVYGNGAEQALDAAFRRIAEIDARMTVNGTDSEVIEVNTASGVKPVRVSSDTFTVIARGLDFARLGDGAFDITVGPLVKLWGIGTSAARVPSPREIRDAVALIGWRDVVLSPKEGTVFLKRPGMALDLGAIAKGYAADEASRVLREHGIASALVNLGGNVLTVGAKPDGTPWRIGAQNPEQPRGTHVGIVETGPSAVVTSGSYERYFEVDGKRYHHILDTRTGFPVSNGLSAVTIVTADSMTADGYSTLVFALGLQKGRALVESSGGAIEALFITDRREIYLTAGLKNKFRLTNTQFTLKE
jgi:thiamine biosynthesis lipoprotein